MDDSTISTSPIRLVWHSEKPSNRMDNGRWIRVESTDTAFLALRFAKSFETHKLRHNLLLVERFIKEVELV